KRACLRPERSVDPMSDPMGDALARDPVFGEVARALCPRSLGVVDRQRNEKGWGAIEIALRTAAVTKDIFASTADWYWPWKHQRHVLQRIDGPNGWTRVTFAEGRLATDA